MDDKLKKLILLMEVKNEEKFSDFSKSIEQLDKQDIELSNDIVLLYKELSKIEDGIKSFDVSEQIKELKSDIENIQLQKGDKGDKGDSGKDGLNGKDGRDGLDGLNGKDGERGDKGDSGSPDTPEQIVEKINTLENVIDIKTIKDFPKIEGNADIKRQVDTIGNQVLRLLSRPKTTGGGGTWGSITGTLSNQTDLQAALNAKQNTITTGTTAQYFRGDLSLATFPTNVSTFTNDSGYITSSALTGYVPNTRTLTINGTTLDLSADRSWTIATPTASTGLTNTSGTWIANLSTGVSGGQSVIGGTASGNNLTLSSTSNATKGKILFGTSAYDEVNNRLGIGTTTPGNLLSIVGNSSAYGGVAFNVKNSNVSGDTIFSLSSSNNRTLNVQVTGDSYAGNQKGAYLFTDGGLSNMTFMTDGGVSSGGSGYISFATGGFTLATQERMRITSTGKIGIGITSPTALLMLAAGTATANTAPLKFTTGTNTTIAVAGQMEYNNTFHLTNSDATRRHVVTAPNTTKVTAAAPYTNDGYITINIGGTDFKVMTTA